MSNCILVLALHDTEGYYSSTIFAFLVYLDHQDDKCNHLKYLLLSGRHTNTPKGKSRNEAFGVILDEEIDTLGGGKEMNVTLYDGTYCLKNFADSLGFPYDST